MSDYGDFARFYDKFTQNVDYSARARYFDAVIQKYNPNAKRLLDLACGTGSLSFGLEQFGYDIVAVDNSYEMLSVAAEKRGELESSVLFLCQEMSELDLFGTIDATVCALDSINHILDENELLEVFKKVSLFSNKGAVFVFPDEKLYVRYSTDFSERAYEIDVLKSMLLQSGFEVKAVFDDDSFLPIRRDSQRAIIVAKKI